MAILDETRKVLSYIGLGAENIAPLAGKSTPRRLVAFIFVSVLLIGVLFAVLLIFNLYPNGPAAILFPIVLTTTFLSQLLV